VIRIKVCGITNIEDALAAVELGADALGFVLAHSPRQVSQKTLKRLVAGLPPFISKVGVFVDSPLDEVKNIMSECGLTLAQLHGSESPEYCQALYPRAIKAFQVKDAAILTQLPLYKVSAYLLDGYHSKLKGGSGQSFDWEIAQQARGLGRIILSGGLTPENVAQAIAIARPYGVDVSSGVEVSPGKKDHHKLAAFIKAAKESKSEAA
jgi:phosphoribosylanthranilate isomerase